MNRLNNIVFLENMNIVNQSKIFFCSIKINYRGSSGVNLEYKWQTIIPWVTLNIDFEIKDLLKW